MELSKSRLLLNAEPFGFGPTAAVAAFFPYLRERFASISYIGKGHTLDLQQPLSYDAVHDLSDLSREDENRRIAEICKSNDILLTACDFGVAEQAMKSGCHVIIYDPLTWYWKNIPDVVKKTDLYLAQNFLGVSDRIAKDKDRFSQTKIVPPIVDAPDEHVERNYVLINLGGLRNPFLPSATLVDYAKVVLRAVSPCLEDTDSVVIATSNGIADSLSDDRAKSYSLSDMGKILERTKFAFMTPGLGNIYDAANHGIPTVWLPPANDSQGQQLRLLQSHNMCDGYVGWESITGAHIDYSQDQNIVLQNIAQAIQTTTRYSHFQDACDAAMLREGTKSRSVAPSLTRLIEKFGRGGAQNVANSVHDYAQSVSGRVFYG
jgi:hypothetical protein